MGSIVSLVFLFEEWYAIKLKDQKWTTYCIYLFLQRNIRQNKDQKLKVIEILMANGT